MAKIFYTKLIALDVPIKIAKTIKRPINNRFLDYMVIVVHKNNDWL